MKLDHVVYFTRSTPKDIVKWQEKEGYHAVIGGSHEKWGTQNALLYTRNAYVEWLSVERMDIARQSDQLLTKQLLYDLERREGWGTLCFSVDDIELHNRQLESKGFNTSGVLHAQRTTPGGEIRKWKMLFANNEVSDNLPLPFFIEWEEAEDERFRKLRNSGVILPSNERLEIRKCVFEVRDSRNAVSTWAKLLACHRNHDGTIQINDVVLEFREAKDADMERMQDVVIERVG